MKKTAFFILLTLVLATMLVSCQSHTHDFVDGVCTGCGEINAEPTAAEYFTFTQLDDGTYSIAAKDIKNLPEKVVIPSSYNGKPVTVIAENAFAGRNVTEKIEHSGETVEVNVYYNCKISTVIIPNSIKVISDRAFYNCYDLQRVIMGNSVTHIGDYAFASCKLKTIDLSDSLTYIGEYAFMSAIESIVLPDSLTTIARNAFYGSSLITITIPESVTKIGDGAFNMCDFLCEIVNNSSVELDYVPYSVLEVHKGESKIVNQNGYLFYEHEGKNLLVRYIGNETKLVLPSTFNGKAYDINRYAFTNRREITNIVIPEGVKEIGTSAFFLCESLETVYLPKSITTLYTNDPQLFPNCNSLSDVYYAGSKDDGMAITIITSRVFQDNTYHFEDIIKTTLHYNYTPEK